MAWNQSSETPSGKSSARTRGTTAVASGRRPYRRGLVAAVIVVVGVVAAWLILPQSSRQPVQAETKKPLPIKEVKQAIPAKAETVEINVHGEKKTVTVDEKDGFKYMRYPSGRVVRTKNPYLLKAMEEQAERYKMQPKPPPRDLSGRAYKSMALCQLAQYAIPGGESSPPGPISDKEAVGILEEQIEIKPDDTPRDIEEKEYLVELQAEFREYMKNGGHAEAFFNKVYERQQIEAEAVNTARKEIRALVKEGREEDARQALETYNKYLESKGIRPLKATKNLFRRKPTTK